MTFLKTSRDSSAQCGVEECEEAIKDENGATTRCIPFVQAKHSDVCVHCGKPAKCEVYFGKAY